MKFSDLQRRLRLADDGVAAAIRDDLDELDRRTTHQWFTIAMLCVSNAATLALLILGHR